MEYLITHTIDASGGATIEKGKNEEEAKTALVDRVKEHYPNSVLTILSIKKVEKSEKEKENS